MRCHLGALAVGAVALAAGCSPGRGEVELRVDGGEPVYYVGESFEGLPLTHAEVEDDRALLVYGDCEARSDAGCSPPLQLQESYPPVGDLRREATCDAPGPARRGDDPHSTVVFAGPTTITIYATTSEQARRVVRSLRPAPGACS